MFVEPLRECFDELKQKLQGINISPDTNTNTISTPVLTKQEAVSYDKAFTKERMHHRITSHTDSTASKTPLSTREKRMLYQGSRSLPRIYDTVTNPSIDDKNGEIWR